MTNSNIKVAKRARRHTRIRSKIFGTSEKPRLSVFKSNTTLYLQLIDDAVGKTLAAATTRESKAKTMLEKSKEAGIALAKKALALKVKAVVFDRGGFVYTGRVKAAADGAREGGLTF